MRQKPPKVWFGFMSALFLMCTFFSVSSCHPCRHFANLAYVCVGGLTERKRLCLNKQQPKLKFRGKNTICYLLRVQQSANLLHQYCVGVLWSVLISSSHSKTVWTVTGHYLAPGSWRMYSCYWVHLTSPYRMHLGIYFSFSSLTWEPFLITPFFCFVFVLLWLVYLAPYHTEHTATLIYWLMLHTVRYVSICANNFHYNPDYSKYLFCRQIVCYNTVYLCIKQRPCVH